MSPDPRKKATTKGEAKRRAPKILTLLKKTWPDAHCELLFDNPLELLAATILSAQCTDVRVNQVTRELFQKYRTALDFAQAPEGELEEDIRSTGFFNNKARSLRGMGKTLVELFGGEIPKTLEELTQVPGAARKTANVVLGSAFGIASGIVVDTHVHRLSHRLGLSSAKQAVAIERDLIALFPEEDWIFVGHAIIWHGRRVCHARKPNCADCTLRAHCPSAALYEAEASPSSSARGKRLAKTPSTRKTRGTGPKKTPKKKTPQSRQTKTR